jgi:ADP-heptose:LPS heptosyltransferase
MSTLSKPHCVVYIRPDTIGDLVIFSSALLQLCAAWPEARHILLVRDGYETLAPLFPPRVEWHTTGINPFKQQLNKCQETLTALLAKLDELNPDMIVAGAVHRTWLEVAIAAHFTNARRISLGKNLLDSLNTDALRYDLGIKASEVFNEAVPVDASWSALRCNHALADHLIGSPAKSAFPCLTIPLDATRAAAEFLAANNLASGEYIVLFPAGIANVPIKAWPADRFADLAAGLRLQRKLPILLLGHASEAHIINEVAARAAQQGAPGLPTWLGSDGDICILAALLAQCRLYIGNDTGAMHIAAALDRTVVGIFGGGTWPCFRPAGRRVLAVVHPLPCFGCAWDCSFGDALCLKTIGLSDVQRAVDFALNAPPQLDFDEIVEAAHLSTETIAIVAVASSRYKTVQNDRIARQQQIELLNKIALQQEVKPDTQEYIIHAQHQQIHSLNSRLLEISDHLGASKEQLAAFAARLDLAHRTLQEHERQLTKQPPGNGASLQHRKQLAELNAKLEELDGLQRQTAAALARKNKESELLQRAAWVRLGAKLRLLKAKPNP